MKIEIELSFTKFLVAIIISICYLGGIINAFNVNGIKYGTIIPDVAIVILYLTAIIYAIVGRNMIIKQNNAILSRLFVLFFSLGVLLFFFQSNDIATRIIGFRNLVFYSFIFLCVLIIDIDVEKIIDYIVFFGSVDCIYAISQFVFRKQYPVEFLDYRGRYLFSIAGTDWFRVTGLVGTTIDFGLFADIIFALSFALYMSNKRFSYLIGVISSFGACILTFGRASIAGLILEIVIIYILIHEHRITRRSIMMILVGGVGSWVAWRYFSDTFFIQRLLSKDATSIASSSSHRDVFSLGIKLVTNNIWGLGYGNTSIADGYWFSVLLDVGIFIGIIYIVLLVAIFITDVSILRANKEISGNYRSIVVAHLAMTITVFVSNLLDSAFYNKNCFITWWILAAIINKSDTALYVNKDYEL